jgi:hypothetical protein
LPFEVIVVLIDSSSSTMRAAMTAPWVMSLADGQRNAFF